MKIIYLFLVVPLVLATTYEMAKLVSYNVTVDDLECMKYFGIKKLFNYQSQDNFDKLRQNLQTINKAKMTADPIIPMPGTSLSPSSLIARFTSYINSTLLYNIVWLTPLNYNLDCNFLNTYVYYCLKSNILCGFQLSDAQWSKITGDNKTACTEISVLPLFYNGPPQSFKPMGGWKTYKYASSNTSLSFCYSDNYTLYSVENKIGNHILTQQDD